MRKYVLATLALILTIGFFTLGAEEVMVPLGAIKSSCYSEIDMTKTEFPLPEIGRECVTESWVEENLSQKETLPKDTPKERNVSESASFERSRTKIFDLLANPEKIEYSLDAAWKYSVTGWERSDLSSGEARWLTRSGGFYNYELVGNPASEFTLIGGITGESQDSANYLVRAALVIRAIGVAKEDAGSILSDLISKAADNPNKKFERRVGDISVHLTFMPSISMLSLTLEAT